MTSKPRSRPVSQLAQPVAAKLRRDAIAPEALGGESHPFRHESRPPDATQRDVAGYIEGLAAGLRAMAQSADLDSLAYFLEMARLEASILGERLERSGTDKGANWTE
jgi:hypothetical protein